MGATLPAIARWVQTTQEGVSWLGFFYGGNIAGAVFGCLLAGFYLLRVHDMATATCVAAVINVEVAALAFLLARTTASGTAAVPTTARPASLATGLEPAPGGAATVLVAIALSGFCALAAEVVWTRLLALLLGATVYSFAIILAVYLLGLGIGSALGSLAARSLAHPRAALGWCQLLPPGAMARVGLAPLAAQKADSLPYGRKRALELALALALDPSVLLLDEPTAGMGLEDVDRTVALIARVRDGRTVVMVEHNMNVVRALADRVTVLQAGRVLASGSYDEVRADERVIAAYLGSSHAAH
jgi:hypothetical protein